MNDDTTMETVRRIIQLTTAPADAMQAEHVSPSKWLIMLVVCL